MLERQSSKKCIGVGADAIIVGGTIGAMAGGTIGDIAGVIITAAGIAGVTIVDGSIPTIMGEPIMDRATIIGTIGGATGARGSASTSASDVGRSVTLVKTIPGKGCLTCVRLYGPKAAVSDGSYMLPDIVGAPEFTSRPERDWSTHRGWSSDVLLGLTQVCHAPCLSA